MAKDKAPIWREPKTYPEMNPDILMALMKLAQATDLPVQEVSIEEDNCIHVIFCEEGSGAIHMDVRT